MDINFIVTCYDNEEQLALLLKLLESYKKIKPTVVVSYSGEKEIPCHVRITNTIPATRELAMTVEGYRVFKRFKNTNKKFVKLSARVWPVDEDALIELFKKLEENKVPFAGNYWHHNLTGSFAADFFVADFTYGNFLDPIDIVTNDTEVTLYQQLIVRMKKKVYLIPERTPIFWSNLFECKPLGLIMYEDIEVSLQTMKDWGIE